jgi:uncharacterized protein
VPLVGIHYHRPPDRTQLFRQYLVHDTPEVKITLATDLTFEVPVRIHDRIVLETGSEAVWFTMPGVWHDIGRLHRADGTFTGIYANIITPCAFETPTRWRTTDWFLDLWIDPDGRISILDEDEFEDAIAKGYVDETTEARVREEATRLKKWAEAGEWPPPIVHEWTRERAREALTSAPTATK